MRFTGHHRSYILRTIPNENCFDHVSWNTPSMNILGSQDFVSTITRHTMSTHRFTSCFKHLHLIYSKASINDAKHSYKTNQVFNFGTKIILDPGVLVVLRGLRFLPLNLIYFIITKCLYVAKPITVRAFINMEI